MENKKFWDSTKIIAAITAYIYTATVFMQLGQNLFFNTHYSFINASIVENAFFLFIVLQIFPAVIKGIPIWQWLVVVGTILLSFVPCWFGQISSRLIKSFWLLVFIIFILSSLQIWYNIGYGISSDWTRHFVLASGCDFTDANKEYVVTSFYEGKAVLVPVDKNTHKMEGKFFVKDLSSLTCGLEYKDIGKIER